MSVYKKVYENSDLACLALLSASIFQYMPCLGDQPFMDIDAYNQNRFSGVWRQSNFLFNGGKALTLGLVCFR